jgi:two-component sensor histidine kinase
MDTVVPLGIIVNEPVSKAIRDRMKASGEIEIN